MSDWSPAERQYLIDSRAAGVGATQQAAQLGRSISAVHEQLKQLRKRGALAVRHRRLWSADEKQRLVTLLDAGTSIPAIARQLDRTIGGVQDHVNALRLHPRERQSRCEGMSVTDVARELGTAHDLDAARWIVLQYIRRGWLVATRRTVARQSVYSVAQDDVRAFVAQHGGYLALTPDADWAPLVEEARRVFARRYISRRALCALIYVSENMLRRWRVRGFPMPALRLHQRHGGDHYERSAVWAWLCAHPEHLTRAAREELG